MFESSAITSVTGGIDPAYTGARKEVTGDEGGKVLKSGLDKDSFLKLLVTQLRFQNPVDPMKNEEFVAQMAQFSSLEQMKNVSENLDKLSNVTGALGVLGKTVTVMDQETGTEAKDVVKSLSFEDEKLMMEVNGKKYEIGSVIDISI